MTTKPATITDLQFIDLGRLGYGAAFAEQQRVHEQVLEGRRGPTVLMVEHEPVITVSRRDGAAGHLLASLEHLRRQGVELCETDRGGDITYHGPGQLVVYPILPLERYKLSVRQYVRLLEQVIIDTLAEFGVEGRRDEAAVGVWAPGSPHGSTGSAPESAKIAAIGVRIRRWISLHGLALNVTTNLDHFKLIVPCGLARPVTSLRRLLGDDCPAMPQVKDVLARVLNQALSSRR